MISTPTEPVESPSQAYGDATRSLRARTHRSVAGQSHATARDVCTFAAVVAPACDHAAIDRRFIHSVRILRTSLLNTRQDPSLSCGCCRLLAISRGFGNSLSHPLAIAADGHNRSFFQLRIFCSFWETGPVFNRDFGT